MTASPLLSDPLSGGRTAASGRKLPTWNVTRAFVNGCGGDEKVWYEQWSQVRRELNARQNGVANGHAASAVPSGTAPESALNGQAPTASEPALKSDVAGSSPRRAIGIRQHPALIRVALLVSVAALLLLAGGVVINWFYGQEDKTDPAAAASPPVIPTFIHGEYQGDAGLYETPHPSQSDIDDPLYTVQRRTGELKIVCQVSDGAVMKAALVNAAGDTREETNDIWYRIFPSNYYIPAIYTTYPYGVEGILPPDAPYGTEIPECENVS